MDRAHRELRERGPRPLVLPGRSRRRHGPGDRPGPPARPPNATTPQRRGPDHRVHGGHAHPRRLHLRAAPSSPPTGPPSCAPADAQLARAVPGTARRRRGHRRPLPPRGDRHAGPHPRPPRLPARTTTSGPVVLFSRRVADGRHGRAHRPARRRAPRGAGPRPLPGAARPDPDPARRSARLPDPRRRVVLLRPRRRGPHHHHRPGARHQPAARRGLGGRVRRPAARRSRVVPRLLPAPPRA